MGCDTSEQIKSLPDESDETSKGNDEHNSTSQVDKQDENNQKETAEEENLSASDKPGGEVRVDQREDTTEENHEIKADEQVKEIIQGNQESQEHGSKDFLQRPDLATEDEYWNLWEAVKVDDIDVVLEQIKHIIKTLFFD